ncbi:hypothetical protein [Methanobrevibacter sp.]
MFEIIENQQKKVFGMFTLGLDLRLLLLGLHKCFIGISDVEIKIMEVFQ